jgi:hypothetical protein
MRGFVEGVGAVVLGVLAALGQFLTSLLEVVGPVGQAFTQAIRSQVSELGGLLAGLAAAAAVVRTWLMLHLLRIGPISHSVALVGAAALVLMTLARDYLVPTVRGVVAVVEIARPFMEHLGARGLLCCSSPTRRQTQGLAQRPP